MNRTRIAHLHTSSNGTVHPGHAERKAIATPAPRHTMIDAQRARNLLAATARLLSYASESSDGRELLAGLDLLRKMPAMLPGLEIRS